MKIEKILEKIELKKIPEQVETSSKRTLVDPFEGSLRDPVSVNIIARNEDSMGVNFQYAHLTEHRAVRFCESSSKIPSFQMHQHDYYEMMYIYKGSLRQQIEQDAGCCEAGEFYFMNRNINHLERYYGQSICIFFCFREDFLATVLKELSKQNSVREFLESNMMGASYAHRKQYMYFRPANGKRGKKELDKLFETILEELFCRAPGYRYFLRGAVVRLFSELGRPETYHCLYQMRQSNYWPFEQAVQFIRQRKGQLSRQQLSQHMGYSADYLNRLFQQNTSMSLTDYFNMVKIEYASQLLCDTDLSIQKIAEQAGYQNKSYFYRLFEKKMKITPQKYRELYSAARISE